MAKTEQIFKKNLRIITNSSIICILVCASFIEFPIILGPLIEIDMTLILPIAFALITCIPENAFFIICISAIIPIFHSIIPHPGLHVFSFLTNIAIFPANLFVFTLSKKMFFFKRGVFRRNKKIIAFILKNFALLFLLILLILSQIFCQTILIILIVQSIKL